MSTSGSGIDFFVRYAEAEGALAEVVPEGAVLVLPEELRTVLRLPEEIGLTEDPETARDDGFLLVTTGHPLLLAAARTVLERGDVGCGSLPRPDGLPPTPGVLEEKAREHVHADHGRMEVTDTPMAADVTVLRVGALLTYSISIDERVQELEEAWVLADCGRVVPPELIRRLQAMVLEPGTAAHTAAPTGKAVAGAHQLLCGRARRRADDLARQTSARLHSQLGVVDDYYGRVLSSIDERMQRASSDRVALLSEQADATKVEWKRRRAEVADDLTPSFEVQPFRLHLIAVPSYHVQATVRRGARRYPLPLTYVPLTSSFLPPPCPSCGSEAILVAGKDRLGCRRCMAPPRQGDDDGTGRFEDRQPIGSRPVPVETTPEPPLPPDRPTDSPAATGVPTGRRPQRPSDRSPSIAGTAPTPARTARKRSSGRVTPKGSGARSSSAQSGIQVALSFWSSVRSGELRPRDAVPDSPMQALLRLYGSLGPALAIGLEDIRGMTAVTASPVAEGPRGVCSSAGELQRSGEDDTPFSLFWRPGSRSSLVEVEAFPLGWVGAFLARRDEFGKAWRHRYRQFPGSAPGPDRRARPDRGAPARSGGTVCRSRLRHPVPGGMVAAHRRRGRRTSAHRPARSVLGGVDRVRGGQTTGHEGDSPVPGRAVRMLRRPCTPPQQASPGLHSKGGRALVVTRGTAPAACALRFEVEPGFSSYQL